MIPMLTQLSCLIFGWIRYRREANQLKTQQLDDDQIDWLTHKGAARPDYISYFDPTVEFYTVDVIKYLRAEREQLARQRRGVKEE